MTPSVNAHASRHVGFFTRCRDELLVGLIATLVGGLFLTGLAFWLTRNLENQQEELERARAQRAERLENLRFVRERASMDATKPFSGLDLRGMNISGLDLHCEASALPEVLGPDQTSSMCADFRGADLSVTDMSGAALDRANLSSARLEGADLTDATLVEAWLSEATMTGVVAYEADFTRADLSGARMGDSTLGGADFQNANLLSADLTGANLAGADLRGVILYDADLTRSVLLNADLTGAMLGSLGSHVNAAKEPMVTEPALSRVCYNDETRWPRGISPPPPQCPDELAGNHSYG